MPRVSIALALVLLLGRASFATDLRAGAVAEAIGSGRKTTFEGVTIQGALTLVDRAIAQRVEFRHCTFDSVIDFTHSEFAKGLALTDSQFRGVNLTGAHLRDLDVDRSSFDWLWLREAHVDGSILGTHISVRKLNLNSARVGGNVLLPGIVVIQGANLILAKIDGNLEMNDAQLKGDADLAMARVGGFIDLNRVRFEQDLDLSHAEVHGNVELEDAVAASPKHSADFNSLKAGLLGADRAVFAGEVNLVSARIADLIECSGCVFRGHVDARNMKVERNVLLRGSTIGGRLWLVGSEVGGINVTNIVVPEANHEGIYLDGMKFDSIVGDEEDPQTTVPPWGRLKAFLARTGYSPDTYAEVERSFARAGEQALADDVHVESKRREAFESVSRDPRTWPRFLWSMTLWLFVRYGRSPSRALAGAIFFVLLGWLVFGRAGTLVENDRAARPRSPFWFSFDAFAPLLDLGYARSWSVDRANRKTHLYFTIHRLAGVVLIPFAIAALTGLLK